MRATALCLVLCLVGSAVGQETFIVFDVSDITDQAILDEYEFPRAADAVARVDLGRLPTWLIPAGGSTPQWHEEADLTAIGGDFEWGSERWDEQRGPYVMGSERRYYWTWNDISLEFSEAVFTQTIGDFAAFEIPRSVMEDKILSVESARAETHLTTVVIPGLGIPTEIARVWELTNPRWETLCTVTMEDGDLNSDCSIDAADAAMMFGNWTGDSAPAVPEPSFSWWLLLAVLGKRHRARAV